MKVLVFGLRGFPGVAGGVESHCQHLYPELEKLGVCVEVIVRSTHQQPRFSKTWQGVQFRTLWAPKSRTLEAFVHSLISVLYAAVTRPDVLHIHSIGPAIFTPIARLFLIKVLVTYHASDYEQKKWGRFGRSILRIGERFAMRFAHEVISVSHHGARGLKRLYGRDVTVIPNGVEPIEQVDSGDVHRELDLQPKKYVLHVGRSIPDKRQDDLIRAFRRAELPGWKLVLVGDLSGDDEYSTRVRTLAADDPRVVLAGYRDGSALSSLLSNAGCFVLPSSYEGLPVALLEALSAGIPVLASDIDANHEIELPESCYFPVGDIETLANKMPTAAREYEKPVVEALKRRVEAEFSWPDIAARTFSLYQRMIAGQGSTNDLK